jgi:hypothetical protein
LTPHELGERRVRPARAARQCGNEACHRRVAVANAGDRLLSFVLACSTSRETAPHSKPPRERRLISMREALLFVIVVAMVATGLWLFVAGLFFENETDI